MTENEQVQEVEDRVWGTDRVTRKSLQVLLSENPDGKEGSGATRKLNASRGFRTGQKDAEWMRRRSPSKVSVAASLSKEERERRVAEWRAKQEAWGLR